MQADILPPSVILSAIAALLACGAFAWAVRQSPELRTRIGRMHAIPHTTRDAQPDILHWWEKWPIGAVFVAQGLYVFTWYVGARMPDAITWLVPWLYVAGGVAAWIAIDGAMIATVTGMRQGRYSYWSVAAIIVTAAFGAGVALNLHGAVQFASSWLHAGFALTIVCYLMHLAAPRHAHLISMEAPAAAATPATVTAPATPLSSPPLNPYNAQRRLRLRTNGGFHSRREWLELCQQFGYRCAACGESKPLTQDHVVSLSAGGRNSIDNIQPLCGECNGRKGAQTIDYRPAALARLERVSASGDTLDDRKNALTTRRDKVSALAAEQGVSQRTIWRRVKAGEIEL